jgi:uncharacterized membrane protein
MTDSSLPAHYAEGDFRVGRVLSRTFSVLSRNFLTFFTVCAVASLPGMLIQASISFREDEISFEELTGPLWGGLLWWFVVIVLYTFSQAIVLYGAFQDMRGRPVSLIESLRVGFGRFFPIIGLAIVASILVSFASLFFLVPGLILFTMWWVATPACVVERLGPIRSLGRSRQLTKGYRWRIFGLILLLILISAVVGIVLVLGVAAIGGTIAAAIASLIWSGAWAAFYAIAAVVAYHDLRVAKEGVDTEQIAAVFD